MIRIYAQLKAKSLDSCPSLLMAGQPFSAEMRFFCAEHGLEKHVICLGEVSNLELNALYAGTELLLFPSLEEGFGWPILEALAAGCRVVTTDRAPMSEIGGAAAYYLPPAPYGADEQKLTAWATTAAEILWAALTEPRDRHGWRVVEGLRLARHFDQAKMMDAYLEEYRIAIKG